LFSELTTEPMHSPVNASHKPAQTRTQTRTPTVLSFLDTSISLIYK
jgi:hypothetical protein